MLVVDKPAGPTSHDVVARLRRALGVRRVGHTGTLDPLATGVLPLVVGRATRLASFFSGTDKSYVADVRLGASTATYDADPRGARQSEPSLPVDGITRGTIEGALEEFRGTFWQVPPPFSAKKIDGVASYTLARQRQPVAAKPVSVTVRQLTLDAYDAGVVRLSITCSAGFYVRALAHELGQRLGCGGHIEGLRRTHAGGFSLADATSLDVLEAEGTAAAVRLIPMDTLLPDLEAVTLTDGGVKKASHGSALTQGDVLTRRAASGGAPVRLTDAAGTLLGIAEPRPGGALHPVIVLV